MTTVTTSGAIVAGSTLTVGTSASITTALTVAGGAVRTAAVALLDGATVAIDAALGGTFTLTATGNRTILAPTNAVDGQRMVLRHVASGGARTLSLTTGSAGAFRFGSDITGLSATASGKTDFLGAIYNATDSRWDLVAYVKGY